MTRPKPELLLTSQPLQSLINLKSLMALVNQFADFIPAVAASIHVLRPPLSPLRAFVWAQGHQESFERVRRALSATHLGSGATKHDKRFVGLVSIMPLTTPSSRVLFTKCTSRYSRRTHSTLHLRGHSRTYRPTCLVTVAGPSWSTPIVFQLGYSKHLLQEHLQPRNYLHLQTALR